MKLNNFSFHEADVVDLRQDSDGVSLVLDGVKYAENDCSIRMNFRGVTCIRIDSCPMQKIGMFHESGEVLMPPVL